MLGFTLSSFLINLFLLLAVSIPFLILNYIFRKGYAYHRVIFLSIPFLLGHGFLAYLYLNPKFPPQEFGFIGLLLLPIYESIVAVPVGYFLILVFELVNKSRH